MKKILFGICALALSASTFAAVMSTETIDGSSDTSVALPIKLEANVVDGANKLFIEGTSGDVFGDVLSLNFGDLARGQIGQTEGRVRVFRGDTWSTDKFTPTTLGADVTFSFIVDGADTGEEATINKYYQVKMTNTNIKGTTTPDQIEQSSFRAGIALTSLSFDGDDTANSTKVEARVGALTEKLQNTQIEGKYYGSASIVATLGAGAQAVVTP